MKTNKSIFFVIALLLVLAVISNGCSKADVTSTNLSRAADNFEVNRRIVFYNGITGDYMLVIEGYCSLGNSDPAGELSVVCQTGPNQFKKHFLGLSDNVTYFAEQIDPAPANSYQYRIIFRPTEIIPDLELDTP